MVSGWRARSVPPPKSGSYRRAPPGALRRQSLVGASRHAAPDRPARRLLAAFTLVVWAHGVQNTGRAAVCGPDHRLSRAMRSVSGLSRTLHPGEWGSLIASVCRV